MDEGEDAVGTHAVAPLARAVRGEPLADGAWVGGSVEFGEDLVDAEALTRVLCDRLAQLLEVVGVLNLLQDGGADEVGGGGALGMRESVDEPGAAQTEVRLGWLGPTRHADGGFAPYAPLAVHVGASPASLLDAVLREEKGWTYGMRAGFRPRSRVGEFTVSGSFTTESTAEAVGEMVRLLRSVDGGIEERDATEARDYALLTAPMRYATAQVVAHEAAVLALSLIHI